MIVARRTGGHQTRLNRLLGGRCAKTGYKTG
ncbi:hypothetical protein ABIB73_006050 [Bradyrhizobium sp. F1.4.3]